MGAGTHDFFQNFRICFFKDFIKNPQTTFALTYLTHIISGIDGVILMSIILNHKSNQCSSLQQCILTFFFHSSQCIQIFFESIVGMLSIYVLMQVLSICKERIFITIQEFTSFQIDGISIK